MKFEYTNEEILRVRNNLMNFSYSLSAYDRMWARTHPLTTEEIIITSKAVDFVKAVELL